jgi:hypothetical protein
MKYVALSVEILVILVAVVLYGMAVLVIGFALLVNEFPDLFSSSATDANESISPSTTTTQDHSADNV